MITKRESLDSFVLAGNDAPLYIAMEFSRNWKFLEQDVRPKEDFFLGFTARPVGRIKC